MWILEDNMLQRWSELRPCKTEEEAQVALARFVLAPYYGKYQYRIIYKPNK